MKKILVAEDDALYSRIYQTKLTKEGYEVKVAGNGMTALDFFKSFKPDLMILDLIMPEMDGFQVLEAIKGIKKGAKVIVMSNLGQDSDIKKAKDLGADDYMVKTNISIQEMVEKVEGILGDK